MPRRNLQGTLLISLLLAVAIAPALAEKREVQGPDKEVPSSVTGQTGKEIVSKDGAPMVLVPSGVFKMGSDEYGGNDENPAHRVFLDAYYIDKYEVTIGRYERYMKATGAEQPEWWEDALIIGNKNLPVIGVNWNDAFMYCRWAGKRIPTEAEWEKAAGGLDGRMHPWGNEAPSPKRANYGHEMVMDTNRYVMLTPVGHFENGKSPYGVYDMAGNVQEWVADWFDHEYYKKSPDRNPTGPSEDNDGGKVVRGGSFIGFEADMVVRNRSFMYSDLRRVHTGLRCAKTP